MKLPRSPNRIYASPCLMKHFRYFGSMELIHDNTSQSFIRYAQRALIEEIEFLERAIVGQRNEFVAFFVGYDIAAALKLRKHPAANRFVGFEVQWLSHC